MKLNLEELAKGVGLIALSAASCGAAGVMGWGAYTFLQKPSIGNVVLAAFLGIAGLGCAGNTYLCGKVAVESFKDSLY